MKYSAKHLRYKGSYWECTLERWEGCQCNSESVKVLIHQEKRPSLAQIKDCAIWQNLYMLILTLL